MRSSLREATYSAFSTSPRARREGEEATLSQRPFTLIQFASSRRPFDRQAHLNGQVAAALFSKVDEFFVNTPEVVTVDVVASRVL